MISKEKEYLLDAKISGCKIEDMDLYERSENRKSWRIIFVMIAYATIGFLIGVSYGIQLMLP